MSGTAVAYFRCSSLAQAESGLGLEAQRSAVEAFCSAQKLKLVSTYSDEGVSGSTAPQDREMLPRAIAAIASGEATHLVVARLDRLSRDTLHLLLLDREVAKHGGRVVSAAGEGTSGDDPASVLTRTVLSAVAEMERKVISHRTSVALQAKVARGELVGRPPVGFHAIAGELHPNQDYEGVEMTLRLRCAGQSVARIHSKVNEAHPHRNWSKTTLRRIIDRWRSPKRLHYYEHRSD